MLAALAVMAQLAGMPAESGIRSEPPSVCSNGQGFTGEPFVPTATMAEGIFRVVQLTLGQPRKYPRVEVRDAGDRWLVSENAANDPPPDVNGGGQFHLFIDKCSGAFSDAAYNR